jgi:hypothetical protein
MDSGPEPRAACITRENDLDDLPSDFNPLNERADYVSTAMPVSGRQMRPNHGRELTKTARRKSPCSS